MVMFGGELARKSGQDELGAHLEKKIGRVFEVRVSVQELLDRAFAELELPVLGSPGRVEEKLPLSELFAKEKGH